MTTDPLILLIEDELHIRRFLRAVLTAHRYRLIEAATAAEGLVAAQQQPALVILDLGLPDLDGLEVMRRLRTESQIPIVVLSARGQEGDKVAALELGADDYVTKPFNVDELLARLRATLRRAMRPRGESAPVFTAGSLRVDLANGQVSVAGRMVYLTPTEYRLLAELVRHAGKVLTHRDLLRAVWGLEYENESQYLRVYMGQLRHKLEENPARPRLLRTEPGVGYRLLTDDPDGPSHAAHHQAAESMP
jgi:two-component system KDP operon response regulator KdpE